MTTKGKKFSLTDILVAIALVAAILFISYYSKVEARDAAAGEEAREALLSMEEETQSVVGVDIEPGIYKLEAEGDYALSYNSCKVTEGDNNEAIFFVSSLYDPVYVELTDGQILTVGIGIKYTNLSNITVSNHYLTRMGWCIVGIDCKEGVYELVPLNISEQDSYYIIHEDAKIPRHDSYNDRVQVTNRTPDLVLQEGDIIEFSYCYAQYKREIDPEDITVEEPITKSVTQTHVQSERKVYITNRGIRYHSHKHCRGLNNANEVFYVTLSEAKDRGFTPCKICC